MVLSVVMLFLQAKATLNHESRVFINNHKSASSLIEQLDPIFCSLNPKLRDFLDGKDVRLKKTTLLKLFHGAGFIVYKIHSPFWGAKVARVVLAHRCLPEFFLKIGYDPILPLATISRIIIADFLNNLVQMSFLHEMQLGVIKKKLYHKPGYPEDLNDFNYIVISPRIHGVPLAKEKTREGLSYTNRSCEFFFKKFIRRPGFKFIKSIMGGSWDHYPYNLILGTDRKLYYVDTDPVHEDLLNPGSFANMIINLTLGINSGNSSQ